MNATVQSFLSGLVATLMLAGCLDGSGELAPTTSSAVPAPPPKVVLSDFRADACPPNAPVQTVALRQRFVVDEGFDRIIVEFGETGEGLVAASIRYVEENKNVWMSAQHPLNTAPTLCGDHGSHGAGQEVTVEPGEYEAAIQYTGAVDVVLSVTARSSRGNTTEHADH